MKHIHVFCLLALTIGLAAQSPVQQSPVKETFAYSRATIPGIPGDRDAAPSSGPFPTSYLIYVVVKKGAAISVTGVYLQGKWHAATLKRVDSPVLTEHDPSVPTGKKDTLVRRTSDDVYQVEVAPDATDHAEDKIAQRYEVVVCLTSGSSSWHGLVKKIVPLRPAAAM